MEIKPSTHLIGRSARKEAEKDRDSAPWGYYEYNKADAFG